MFAWLCCLLQGINAALFWEKVNFTEYIPMVPTSAITGDGMGDLIALVVTYSQRMLAEKLMFSKHLEAIVMEVRHRSIATPPNKFPCGLCFLHGREAFIENEDGGVQYLTKAYTHGVNLQVNLFDAVCI